jgi:outer membrane protein assembly factor BamB
VRTAVALLAVLFVAGCGSHGDHASGTPTPLPAEDARAGVTSRDWPMFGYDSARTNDAPRGIAPEQVTTLRERRVALPGTVDSSPIFLAGVSVDGARRDVIVMTTTYGRTLALDAATAHELWRFEPASYGSLAGTPQITTATPVSDRRAVYAASPDGVIHKLRLSDGNEVTTGEWPATVTADPAHEKLASALNLDGDTLLVTTGGYLGDAPPYQGKVVAIDRDDGRITSVLNSLCSDRREIIEPASCPASASAIWGRVGAVVNPADHHSFVTTSNGPFDGRTNWGDSVLELSPRAGELLRHWTPANQKELEEGDVDLGSTGPALLPDPDGGPAGFAIQGGKDGELRLLDLKSSLHGVTGEDGPRLGGERQTVEAPGGAPVFTAIAVLHRRGLTLAFVATGSGTAAYQLDDDRLTETWSSDAAGTSPVIAGGVLWVYDPTGELNAYEPGSGRPIAHFDVPPGHWNSPIVAGDRVFLPTGDANEHHTEGQLSILTAG